MSSAVDETPPTGDPLSEAIDNAANAGRGFGLGARDVVPPLSALAGILAALSGQQPTGNLVADLALSFCFGLVLVHLSQFASARAIGISTLVALVLTGLQLPAALFGVAAVGVAFAVTASPTFDRESRLIAAAVSSLLLGQTVLRLPNLRFVGSSSLLAALAIAPVVVVGLRRLPAAQRRYARLLLVGVSIYVVVATGLAAIAGFSVRERVETGIAQAQDGVASLQAGDQDAAVAHLDAAQQNFDRASGRLGGPLTWPVRFVPIAAQHSRALETASDQGAALAQTAVSTVTTADVEDIRGVNGVIDLQLIEAVNVELTAANGVMSEARGALRDVRTPWLLPQLDDRLEAVEVELAATSEDLDLAAEATAVMPQILGSQGLRRYLVLFVQPAESREYGGFVGAYGILEADRGRLDLVESGSIDVDLRRDDAPQEMANPGDYPEFYYLIGPGVNPQNLTAVADLPTIARAARDLVPKWRLDPAFTIDGVITIDPYAMAGLLELTGPVALEGRAEPLDASNVVDYLLRGQYLEFEQAERAQRQDLLKDLAGATFNQLFAIEVPGPERLGAIFGPVARSNRLGFVTFDDRENAFLDRVLLSGDFPVVPEFTDFLGVFAQTATASKLDGYTHKSITYEVEVDPATGAVSGRGTIVASNGAPPDASDYVLGPPGELGPTNQPLADGSNFLVFGIYTRAEVTALEADTVYLARQVTSALSYQRYPILVEVPVQDRSTITFDTRSQVMPGRYDLVVATQPDAVVGEFTLVVRPAPGWVIVGENVAADGSWSATVPSDQPLGFSFLFAQVRQS